MNINDDDDDENITAPYINDYNISWMTTLQNNVVKYTKEKCINKLNTWDASCCEFFVHFTSFAMCHMSQQLHKTCIIAILLHPKYREKDFKYIRSWTQLKKRAEKEIESMLKYIQNDKNLEKIQQKSPIIRKMVKTSSK